MKYITSLYIIIFLFTSCSTYQSKSFHHDHDIERGPSSISFSATCAKLISKIFYKNPYKKHYPLKQFDSPEHAVKFYEDYIKSTEHTVKEGSKAYLRLQKDAQGNISRTAPVKLLYHGYSDSPGTLKEIASIYEELGYHVVTVRLNDHGLKGAQLQKKALLKSSRHLWREDVDLGLSVAKALAGNKKVHIGGYSMGFANGTDQFFRIGPKMFGSVEGYAPLIGETFLKMQVVLQIINRVTTSLPRSFSDPRIVRGASKEWDQLSRWQKIKYILSDGSFYKSIKETQAFYRRMSWRQTVEMHHLLRELQGQLFNKDEGLSDVPMAIYRVDAENEKTVDNNAIDTVIEMYNIKHVNVHQNPKDIEHPVLHRDFTSSRVNSSGDINPAINETIRPGILRFHQHLLDTGALTETTEAPYK